MERLTLSDETPIVTLTLGQLKEVISTSAKKEVSKVDVPTDSGRRVVYGLRGIQNLFNVSHVTAQKYRNGILAEACAQEGRKIIVDVDKAFELYFKYGERSKL